MDIRENKKKNSRKIRLRGEYGYTRYIKYHNYIWSLILLSACLFVFFLGKTIFLDYEPIFMVISALLILPFAQFLSKAISFSRYQAMPETSYMRLESMSNHFLVLGELPIIRGKHTYFFRSIVITPVGVFGLVSEKSDVDQMKKIIESIIQPKGHHDRVKIFANDEQIYDYLKTKVKSQVQNPDQLKMERIAEALIIKTH